MKTRHLLYVLLFGPLLTGCLGGEAAPVDLPNPFTPGAPPVGNCTETVTEKSGVRSLIQGYDTNPLPDKAVDALKAACNVSTSDLGSFMEGFLCQIEADISLASDAEVQGDVDNLEHVDLSDLTGSCTEINLL